LVGVCGVGFGAFAGVCGVGFGVCGVGVVGGLKWPLPVAGVGGWDKLDGEGGFGVGSVAGPAAFTAAPIALPVMMAMIASATIPPDASAAPPRSPRDSGSDTRSPGSNNLATGMPAAMAASVLVLAFWAPAMLWLTLPAATLSRPPVNVPPILVARPSPDGFWSAGVRI